MVRETPELDGMKYSSAETACRAGIKAKENRHDPSEYEWRVVGDFYFGGSYTWRNLGKQPGDPGFVNSGRELFCTHEYRKKGFPFWKGFWPYSGATLHLMGDVCPEGQTWKPANFACEIPPATLGESCMNTGKPVNVGTGNKFYRLIDYSQQVHHPLRFVRYYNSMRAEQVGWRHSYQRELRIGSLPHTIIFVADDGKEIALENVGAHWAAPSHRKERLYQEADGYRLELPGKTTEYYDLDGRLQRVAFRNGLEIKISYGANQLSVQRFDSTLTITKNGRGQVTSVLTPEGDEFRYYWERGTGVSRLVKVIFPDDTPETNADDDTHYYHYDAKWPSNIAKVVDRFGRIISEVAYDARGRAVSSQAELGAGRSEFTYNANGSTTVTNALGKSTTYHYTQINGDNKITGVEGHASTHCAAANKDYTYYPSGLVESKTDWQGTITRYQYNLRGLETQRVEAEGTSEERIIFTDWHPTLDLPTKVTEPGREILYTYDPEGRLLSRSIANLPLN